MSNGMIDQPTPAQIYAAAKEMGLHYHTALGTFTPDGHPHADAIFRAKTEAEAVAFLSGIAHAAKRSGLEVTA